LLFEKRYLKFIQSSVFDLNRTLTVSCGSLIYTSHVLLIAVLHDSD